MAEPALFQHCESVYAAMLEESTIQDIDGHDATVYQGFLTRLITKLSLPNPYYTYITNALTEMGCILQLRRGGGSTPSLWLLRCAPTIELYTEHAGDTNYSKRHDKYAALQQQMNDLNRRVTALEAQGA